MITIHYVEDNQHKKQSFNVPPEDFIAVTDLLKKHKYNWYTVDQGQNNYNPDQLTLDFGEIKR